MAADTAQMKIYRDKADAAFSNANAEITAPGILRPDFAVAQAQIGTGWAYLLELQAKIDKQITV